MECLIGDRVVKLRGTRRQTIQGHANMTKYPTLRVNQAGWVWGIWEHQESNVQNCPQKLKEKKYVQFKVSTQACWKEIICSEILRALWGDLKLDFFDLDTSIYLHSIVRHPSLHPLPSQLTSLSVFLRPLSYTDFNNNIMLTMCDCVLN